MKIQHYSSIGNTYYSIIFNIICIKSQNVIFFENSFMQKKSVITLHSIELIYDAKSPRFGANISEDGNGLCVEWSAEDSGLIKGDR